VFAVAVAAVRAVKSKRISEYTSIRNISGYVGEYARVKESKNETRIAGKDSQKQFKIFNTNRDNIFVAL